MNKKIFEESVNRLQEVDKVIKSLDPAIREASFKLLQSYITGCKIEDTSRDERTYNSGNKKEFFIKFSQDKPSDNVIMITAYHYSQYGTVAISINDIKDLSKEIGLTIPARIDMTLKKAQKDGKNLFNKVSRGKYKPTVHGEKLFKDKYEVNKGTNKKDEDNL